MSKIALVVTFDVKPDRTAEFLLLIKAHARRSRDNEAGCLQFDVLRPRDAPDRVMLYEVYRDEEALAAHRAAPYLQKFGEAAREMIDGRSLSECEVEAD